MIAVWQAPRFLPGPEVGAADAVVAADVAVAGAVANAALPNFVR